MGDGAVGGYGHDRSVERGTSYRVAEGGASNYMCTLDTTGQLTGSVEIRLRRSLVSSSYAEGVFKLNHYQLFQTEPVPTSWSSCLLLALSV